MTSIDAFFENYAIVFAGGGARGAWQLGVWKTLEELKIPKPKVITGTSVGALNAAMFSQGDLGRAEQVWRNIDTIKVLNLEDEHPRWITRMLAKAVKEGTSKIVSGAHYAGVFIASLKNIGHSLFRADGLSSLIANGVQWRDDAFRIPIYICARNKETGKVEYFPLNVPKYPLDIKQLLLRASASIPGIFPEVNIAGKIFTDGGFLWRNLIRRMPIIRIFWGKTSLENLDNAPLTPIAQNYPDIKNILLVGLTPNEMTYRDNFNFKDFRIFPLLPNEELGSQTSVLDFSPEHTDKLIESGQKDAREWLERLDRNYDQCVLSKKTWKEIEEGLDKPIYLGTMLADDLGVLETILEQEREIFDTLHATEESMAKYIRWCEDNPLPSLKDFDDFDNLAERIKLVRMRFKELPQGAQLDQVKLFASIDKLLAIEKEDITNTKRKNEADIHKAFTEYAEAVSKTGQNLLTLQKLQIEESNALLEWQCRRVVKHAIEMIQHVREHGMLLIRGWRGQVSLSQKPQVSPMFKEKNLHDLNALWKTAVACPENLAFYDLGMLKAALQEGEQDVHMALLAEVFVRYYLFENQEYRQLIEHYLQGNECFAVDTLKGRDKQVFLASKLWSGDSELSLKTHDAFKRRLHRLLDADGWLPLQVSSDAVDSSGMSCLMPFTIDTCVDASSIVDLDNQEIHTANGETLASLTLDRVGLKAKVTLFCKGIEGLDIVSSIMELPLQVAAWAKTEEELPRFYPFSLLAIGGIDADGRLSRCSARAIEQVVGNMPKGRLFFFPAGAELSEKTDDKLKELEAIPLEPGMPIAKVLEKLLEKVEPAAEWSWKFTTRRIVSLSNTILHENISNWDNLMNLLKKARPNKNKYPKEFLGWLLLEKNCYSQNGDTQKARKVCEQALEFARKQEGKCGLAFELEATISLLEILVDEEDFDAIRVIEQELEPRMKHEACENSLQRVYHGQLGHAHVFGCLANQAGFSQRTAEKHIQQALNNSDNDVDVSRYTNYMYLCRAILDFDKEEENDDFEDAWKEYRQLFLENSKAYRRSLRHLLRARVFAWYRYLLKKGIIPPAFEELPELVDILEDDELDWTKAVIAKCLGALFAAKGDRARANALFERAFDAMKSYPPMGVTSVIELTIYAEAYRSLHIRSCLERAREIFKGLPTGVFNYSKSLWQNYLEHPDECAFPGLGYWY